VQPEGDAVTDNLQNNRRAFLRATGAAGAAAWLGRYGLGRACAAGSDDDPQRRPNVVLIMADDLGYECIGANGCTRYQTPHLDRMAEQGIRWTQACSQPLCTPSRVQIMTGIYNGRNYTAFGTLPAGEVTFGHMLKKAGYATCAVGKWQLAKSYNGNWPGQQPGEAGFDEHCLWQVNGRGKRYFKPTLEVNGKARTYPHGYGPDICTEYLIDFIKRHKDAPFFAYYPMILTHVPIVNPPEGSGGFKGMVEHMDKLVGRINGALDELGLRDNTLVIFCGDNGTHGRIKTQTVRGEVKGGKGKLGRTGVHVPMIASWPAGGVKGLVTDDILDFSDFMPTLAKLCGGKLPADRMIDGVSFADRLRGRRFEPRPWSYCFSQAWPGRKRSKPEWFARDKGHKLYGDGTLVSLAPGTLAETPLEADSLTAEQKSARDKLRKVIDRYPHELVARKKAKR
jgi:arylsulfatase A